MPVFSAASGSFQPKSSTTNFETVLVTILILSLRLTATLKSLASRGITSTIIPYSLVLDEVRAGKLGAYPIVTPAVRHTASLGEAGYGRTPWSVGYWVS